MSEFQHIDGVKVEVDQVVYMPTLPSPMDKPYPFVYYVTIYNNSDQVIQVLGRKWIVTESDGACVVVEGNGVIGEKPTLNPGEHFSYNSYHVVAKSAEVNGAFYGVVLNEKGGVAKERFMAEVPEFKLNR